MAPKSEEAAEGDRGLWRDLVAFWILGLTNNYGYVVMLSAAHDIIGQFSGETDSNKTASDDSKRLCHFVSTGAILLADILPSLTAKMLMPFLPFWVNTRIGVAVAFSAGGFCLVGLAQAEWTAVLGVIVTSFSCGIGESTFLAYSAEFDKNVISTWSSGTGGAGVIGSLSYACLVALGVSPRYTMLVMLSFPAAEACAFWLLLRAPSGDVAKASFDAAEDTPFEGFGEKVRYSRELLRYMVPLCSVYFFEYFINQGMFEMVYFEDTALDHAAQYRWLNVDYQVGVFVSRSSVNVVQFRRVWVMAVLQGLNVAYFLSEVLCFWTPSIWIVFALVFWEGLLGGGAYVNTFYRMSQEIPPTRRQFAMAMVVQSDSYGISLAGFAAIPVHNAICALPAPAQYH